MSMPERVRIPAPTGDPFADELEVRIIQSLCRRVSRTEEGRMLAFAIGVASARWIYLSRRGIDAECIDPTEFVAQVKGRLATLDTIQRAQVIRERLDSPSAARTIIQQYLATT